MLPPAVRALVRTVPSVAPVPHRTLLSVTGSQTAEFLNGIVARSIPQANFFSAFIHAQGRVLYDIFAYSYSDARGARGYLIEYDARASEAPPLLPLLKKYVLRSKVKIRDVSEEYDVWAAWGSDTERQWETERKWSIARSGVIEPDWKDEVDWPWGSEPGVIRDRRAVGMGHRLLVKKGDMPQEATTHDVLSSDEYTLHRIVHGVPEGVLDMPPMHAFPMDSDLDIMGGIDFRKGCYVGQELTVRTYHTGTLRKRILPVAIHQAHAPHIETLAIGDFPTDVDIRAHATLTQDAGIPKPRPRGTGKLLTSTRGVGLALLRLEHIEASEKGDVRLEFEVPGGGEKMQVTPWWHEAWPRLPLVQE